VIKTVAREKRVDKNKVVTSAATVEKVGGKERKKERKKKKKKREVWSAVVHKVKYMYII